MNTKMGTMKRILSVMTALLLALGLMACGAKNTGDAPITSKWKVTTINNNGTITDMTGIWVIVDAVNKVKTPEFTSDGTNFTFSMSGKDHKGTLVQNGNTYELHWDNNSNPNGPAVSKATITGNILEVELKEGIVVTFEAR